MGMLSFYFDKEGVLENGKVNFAKAMLENSGLRDKYFSRIFDDYDAFDDEHWRKERTRKGHSTGTTPAIALMAVAIDGKDDKYLLDLADGIVEFNPGAKDMVDYAKKMGEVRIVTNAHPAAMFGLKDEFNIASSHIYTMGRQAEGGRGKLNRMTPEEELEFRSPLAVLGKYRKELEVFLDKYLEACGRIMEHYKTGEGNLADLLNKKVGLFHEVKETELREELEYLLLSERGIMGGHRKAWVVDTYSPRGWGAVAIDDSIVGADMVALAQYGISFNCTNKEALLSCKMNAAVTDLSDMNKVFNCIGEGMVPIDIEKALKYVHSHDTILKYFDNVKAANNEAKGYLKGLYKAGKA
jgi:predicted HAD superfamily phosphohydrolase